VRRLAVLVVLVAFRWAGSAAAAAPQELTVTASDGTPLACGLVLPEGAPPAGGWPGVLLFHGLGQTHAAVETIAATALASAGYASLACDARGLGASGGSFGLDGPRELQDARDLFSWFTARPDVSDTRIGAFGVSLGGGAVWNAAAAGVPFRAIVPAATWTALGTALAPAGVPKTGLLEALVRSAPPEHWDPELAAAGSALLGGTVTARVKAAAAIRSARTALPALTVPTLLLQGRRDFLFDLDQALDAFRVLQGPKKLYVGDLGHPPAANPAGELPHYLGEIVSWFDTYLKGRPRPSDQNGVELAHDPWNGRTTSFATLPPSHAASVALPGTSVLSSDSRASRAARLTGGPHETFGAGFVTVRYSAAKAWTQLVASVSVAGAATPVTLGAVRISKSAGVATIPLLDEVVNLPRGKRLVVTIGASAANGLFTGETAAGSTITIGRVTLKLPLLRAAARSSG
jgi:alpha-beta hydrolase superfamily lysophospholipase